MTDRFNALIVVLESDIREDTAEPLISAIRQLRGVIDVTGSIVSISDHVAQLRAKHDLGNKILEILR